MSLLVIRKRAASAVKSSYHTIQEREVTTLVTRTGDGVIGKYSTSPTQYLVTN